MKKLLIASLLFGSTTSALAAPFVVQDIRVDGVQPGTENAILAQIPVKVGQTATDNDISNVVRTLFLKNKYENIKATREGNTLVIQVSSKPMIADVTLEGNSIIPTEALTQNLDANGITKGETLDTAKLEAFRQSLEEHYRSVGRYNARVETIINNLPNNRAEVKLQIKENDVALLKSIDFVGNNNFDRSTLMEQIELQPDAWWKLFGNKFDGQQFSKDLETLRRFYLNRGYAKFKVVNSDVKLDDEKKGADVIVTVDEGVQYTLVGARIVGDTAGLTTELQPILNSLHLNEPFKGDDASDVEEGIKSALGDKGYANAQVNVTPEFDDANKTMSLNFVVDAGKRYSVRQIRFEGNTVSADSTLRQEMRQQEGTWLSTSLVQLGKLRLDRTGFYETVETTTEAIPNKDDQLDVVYKVKERNTGSINFGIGYGTESGISYQASIKQDNFLGMGSSISLGGSRNDYGTTVNLGYNEPYFTKDGVGLGGNIFYEDYDNSKSSTSASYSRTTFGLNGLLSFPVNENNSYYLGLGYTYNKLKDIYPEYNRSLYLQSRNIDKWSFKAHDYDFSFGWNYNSLNRGVFPTKGVKANLGGKVTIPGSDNKYYKLNLDVAGYYPLNRDQTWVLSAKTNLSYANGFGGKRLPFYQNFSAGGIGTLRGFEYGGVGPHAIYWNEGNKQYDNINYDVAGGNALAAASVELIVPTPFVADKNQNAVRTSLFVDAASVWNTRWTSSEKETFAKLNSRAVDYSDPSRIRASAGIGFQWQSPIGPLVFSYAKPIKKYEGDEIEQFQFSIGGSF